MALKSSGVESTIKEDINKVTGFDWTNNEDLLDQTNLNTYLQEPVKHLLNDVNNIITEINHLVEDVESVDGDLTEYIEKTKYLKATFGDTQVTFTPPGSGYNLSAIEGDAISLSNLTTKLASVIEKLLSHISNTTDAHNLSTYAKTSAVSSTYATKSEVASTYAKTAEVSSTYATKSDVSSTYATKSALDDYVSNESLEDVLSDYEFSVDNIQDLEATVEDKVNTAISNGGYLTSTDAEKTYINTNTTMKINCGSATVNID